VVPALTFPAPAAAAVAVGATPILADVDPETWNASPETVRRALSDRTKAIVAVDQFGVPAELDALEDLAREAEVALVEDAACSIGASLGGRRCGAFGDVATFSFHPRKVITTGEGGALLSRDAEIAARARVLHDHGRREGDFTEIGLNLRLGEVQAAVGRCQLARLDELVARRRQLAQLYLEALGDSGPPLGLTPQRAPEGAAPSYQTFALLLPEPFDPGSRAELIAALRHRGVEAQVASFSLGRLRPFAEAAGVGEPKELPVADSLHLRGLALPLHPAMEDQDVDRVVEALRRCLDEGGPG
jgi:perosamine synthetase